MDLFVNGHANLGMLRTCTLWHFIMSLVILLFLLKRNYWDLKTMCSKKKIWVDKTGTAFTVTMVKLLKSNFSTSNLKIYATSKVLYLKNFNIQLQWTLIKVHISNFFYLNFFLICIATLFPSSHSYFFMISINTLHSLYYFNGF